MAGPYEIHGATVIIIGRCVMNMYSLEHEMPGPKSFGGGQTCLVPNKWIWWGPNGFGSNKIFNKFLNYPPHLYTDTYLQFYLYQTGLVPTKPIWWGPNRFGPHHRGFISVFHLGRDLSGWGRDSARVFRDI